MSDELAASGTRAGDALPKYVVAALLGGVVAAFLLLAIRLAQAGRVGASVVALSIALAVQIGGVWAFLSYDGYVLPRIVVYMFATCALMATDAATDWPDPAPSWPFVFGLCLWGQASTFIWLLILD